ncbi:hypothetical protein PCL_07411 [Purpureocillium lilacinum]|uniref:Uncharacterized protein n=1 Tax=Purpureocillium lilacinum TaxID=33203 RepID=A0A2U3DSA0_PURLI|nr:hypothetical protein PCL_07411 [Purpureocillium lilacinum]
MFFAASDTPSSGATSLSSSQDSLPSSHDPSDSNLIPEDDDVLIPSSSDVSQSFLEGKSTWDVFIGKARNIAPGLWPENTTNPYIAMWDIPALPSKSPHAEFLFGRPMWQMSGCEAGQHDMWSSQLVPGRRVALRLRVSTPSRCDFVPQPASCLLGIKSEAANGLAILTICWSYILSVRLLELQGRKIWYTKNRIRLQEAQERDTAAVYLDGASPSLVRWLSGILCSHFGWRTDGEGLPPWALVPSVDIALFTVNKPPAELDFEPPTSSEATRLLVELCRLFNLGADSNGDQHDSLPAYRAAFLASLMIPYYKERSLRPQFPVPRLDRPRTCSFDVRSEADILQYSEDLRYFMTFSLHPPSLGSVLWSVFWQPDVACNLVSPWLQAALVTLEPTLGALQLEALVKTFALRRPRAALWWLALFLLGDLSTVSWIRRYATKLEEQYGFASLSPPDPIFAAWSGTALSFLDQNPASSHPTPENAVSRADLLRYRFNCKLQEENATLAWRPFGFVHKSDVEVDLWPCLESKCSRSYHSFSWYGVSSEPLDTSLGFRRDTMRHVERVRDDLVLRGSAVSRFASPLEIKLAPSRACSLQMLFLSAGDASGSLQLANAGMSEKFDTRKHPWLAGWRGLQSFETPAVSSGTAKTATAFVLEWLEQVATE